MPLSAVSCLRLLRCSLLLAACTSLSSALQFTASLQSVVVSAECAGLPSSPPLLLLADAVSVSQAPTWLVTPDSDSFGVVIAGDAGAAAQLAFALPPLQTPSSVSVGDPSLGVQWTTSCCSVGCPSGPGCRTYCSVGGGFITRVLSLDESPGNLSLTLSGTIATQFLSVCVRHVPFVLRSTTGTSAATSATASERSTAMGTGSVATTTAAAAATRQPQTASPAAAPPLPPEAAGFLQQGALTVSAASLPASVVPPVVLQVHVARELSFSEGSVASDGSAACDPVQLAALSAYAARLNAHTPSPSPTATASAGYDADALLRGASVPEDGSSYKWSMDQTVIAATTGAVLTIVLGSVAIYTARRLSARPTVEEAR